MIIKRLTAAFGKLNNETLTLSEGLNIIKAPNESGKSTWCAFIRTMLYGVDTADRDKQGYLSDKTRYRPWSGAEMSGEMEITCLRGDITLRRLTAGKAPMRDFKAVFTGTETEVPELTGESAGELLTGVTEQVFRRSAFISQTGVRVEQTPELEKKISALVSAGDETTSYTEADARLREWLRRRKFNKRGEIPALTAELASLEERIWELESAAEKTALLRSAVREEARAREMLAQELEYYAAQDLEAERLKAERAQKNIETANAEAKKLSERLKAYGDPTADKLAGLKGEAAALTSLRTLLEAERLRKDGARSEMSDLSDKLNESPLAGKDTERIATELSMFEKNAKNAKTAKILMITVIPVLLILGMVIKPDILKYIAIGTGGVTAVVLITLFLFDYRRSHKLERLLKRYKSKTISDLRGRISAYNVLSDELRQAKNACDAAEKVVKNAETIYEDARKELTEKLGPLTPAGTEPDGVLKLLSDIERVLRDYERAKSELSAAEKIYAALSPVQSAEETGVMSGVKPRLSRAETAAELERVTKVHEARVSEYNIALGAQRALGDPVVLRGRQNEAKSRLAEVSAQHDALTLAIEVLDRANAELQTRFSPMLSRTAEEYLAKLTDGRYERLVFDKGFNATAKTPEDPTPRNALYLSNGASDQVYFALRLAVCELALPAEACCPIILDDAMVSFDDKRLSNALRLLAELSKRRQVILFSCHGREAELLPEGVGANIVTLR